MYNKIIEYNRPSKYSNECYFSRTPNIENHDKVERHALLQ